MDLALLVYGMSVLSGLNHVITLMLLITLIASFIFLFWFLVEPSDRKQSQTWLKRTTITLSIILPPFLLIPSEKVMYTMVGAYAAQKVAEDPKVQQFSGKVLKIIENKLDSYIDEAAKKVTK